MKFEKLIIVVLFLSIISCGQKETKFEKTNSNSDNGIRIGLIDTIHSKILNQDRELIIYIPESAKDPNRKKSQYPVVYLLDGGYNFVQFIGMLKLYSEMHDTKILPEMIVVGIPNIDLESRMMDLSPTSAGNPELYGGGDKFLEFIKKELFPQIEQNYPVSKNRTIVGSSLGGLAVINALTFHPEMFKNYLMIDGSLDFDNELFLNNPDYSLKGKDLKGKNLYIGIANTATYGSNLESIKKDTIRTNRFVRYSLELVKRIEQMQTDLNMEWKYYEKDTHGSTAFLAQMDGFRFFYSWFEFKGEHKYRNKYFEPKSKKDRFATLTKNHFNEVSKKLGYEFKPEQNWLSGYAYSLNSFQNQPKQAIETYELNIEYYPNSLKVYEDLADFYLSQNDTISAKKYYNKALDLEDNTEIQTKLIKLGI